MIERFIERFIVWYLKRHNVTFEHKGYTVRMFSTDYYNWFMEEYFKWLYNSERRDT